MVVLDHNQGASFCNSRMQTLHEPLSVLLISVQVHEYPLPRLAVQMLLLGTEVILDEFELLLYIKVQLVLHILVVSKEPRGLCQSLVQIQARV